ncbi:hypothetical protein V6N13_022803 [Hibiscus sabdariffa]|uniref:Uncharacterized protein n=1 Tax=Hibiscus sabdariffa TaxID=183260 RepID=A0ABR2NMN8_9ROSI
MTTGRINQVAFLRDVRPACSSTHYLGRGEAITGQDHRSCRGTKCTSYERPGPRPYAHEIFRIQKHDRASMHRCGRIMPIDTLGTSSTTEVHQAATRSLDDKGWQYIQNSIDLGTQHRIPIATLGHDDHKGTTLKRSAAR